MLCAVAGEHLLVVGPPGTGKSEAVRRVADELGGHYFEYLVGRFTEPNELFGPIDLRRLREGVVEVETAGMLPEAEVAFLDEVFLGSTAILNTLLGMLNERVFRRGRTALPVALRVCVGASNALPDDPALAAFADRFLGRIFVDSVTDARLEELLEVGWASERPAPADGRAAGRRRRAGCGRARVRPARRAARARPGRAADARGGDRALRPPRGALAAADRGRRGARRAHRGGAARPLGAADDRADRRRPGDRPGGAGRPDRRGVERLARPRRRAVLARPASPRRAPDGQPARSCSTSLTDSPDDRLRVEAALREIDAGFATSEMPEPLALVRARLTHALDGQAPGA